MENISTFTDFNQVLTEMLLFYEVMPSPSPSPSMQCICLLVVPSPEACLPPSMVSPD